LTVFTSDGSHPAVSFGQLQCILYLLDNERGIVLLPFTAQIRCSDQIAPEHGEMQCTDGRSVGSVCTFACTQESYSIFPSYFRLNKCLRSGRWNMPTPCCTR